MNNPPYLTETESAIKAMSSLEPGETYVYFVGFLDEERLAAPHAVADAAYHLYLAGKVHLTQKRMTLPTSRGVVDWGRGCGKGFRYIATGALPKKKLVPTF